MTTQTRLQAQRRANLKLGLILASTAIVFFVGFVVKMAWLH